MQIDLNSKPLEILQISGTRWLSMRNAIDRILEVWNPLKQYFNKYGSSSQKEYCLSENKFVIQTLSLLVSNLLDCNQYFQNDNLFYSEVYEKLKHTYITTANIILKDDAKSLDFDTIFSLPFDSKKDKDILKNNFDFTIRSKLVNEKEFETHYFGKYDSLKCLFEEVTEEKREQMAKASIQFIYLCLKGMRNKLPYKNEIMRLAQRENFIRLRDLFPNVIRSKKQRDDFASEVSRFGYTYNQQKQKIQSSVLTISPLTIWKGVSQACPNLLYDCKSIVRFTLQFCIS